MRSVFSVQCLVKLCDAEYYVGSPGERAYIGTPVTAPQEKNCTIVETCCLFSWHSQVPSGGQVTRSAGGAEVILRSDEAGDGIPLPYSFRIKAACRNCRFQRPCRGTAAPGGCCFKRAQSSDQTRPSKKSFQMEQNVTENGARGQSASFLGVMQIRHSYPLWAGQRVFYNNTNTHSASQSARAPDVMACIQVNMPPASPTVGHLLVCF